MSVKKQDIVRLYEEFNKSSFAKAGGQVCGCNYRAHYMAEKLKDKQPYPVKKIWVWGETGDGNELIENSFLFAPSYNPETDEYEGYNFHVAAAIDTPDHGLIVFDPALYDGPVKVEQWKGDMLRRKGCRLEFKVTSPDVYAFKENPCEPEPVDEPPSLTTRFRNAASTRFNLFMMRITEDAKSRKWPQVRSEWAHKP